MNNVVLFIGDEPSKSNIDSETAFVGTKSYSRLLGWIDAMNLSVNNIYLQNREDFIFINYWEDQGYFEYSTKEGLFVVDKIVALGNKAEKFCNSQDLECFKLPHPSGKNFKLNDKKFVKDILSKCRSYIIEKNYE